MVSVIIGVVLVIVAVVLWVGHLSVEHALAILIGALGVLVLLYGFGDRFRYGRLGGPRA
jgi:Flp pilus assembly protein protease CpaA